MKFKIDQLRHLLAAQWKGAGVPSHTEGSWRGCRSLLSLKHLRSSPRRSHLPGHNQARTMLSAVTDPSLSSGPSWDKPEVFQYWVARGLRRWQTHCGGYELMEVSSSVHLASSCPRNIPVIDKEWWRAVCLGPFWGYLLPPWKGPSCFPPLGAWGRGSHLFTKQGGPKDSPFLRLAGRRREWAGLPMTSLGEWLPG